MHSTTWKLTTHTHTHTSTFFGNQNDTIANPCKRKFNKRNDDDTHTHMNVLIQIGKTPDTTHQPHTNERKNLPKSQSSSSSCSVAQIRVFATQFRLESAHHSHSTDFLVLSNEQKKNKQTQIGKDKIKHNRLNKNKKENSKKKKKIKFTLRILDWTQTMHALDARFIWFLRFNKMNNKMAFFF